jgi:hypothetical protein
MPKEKSPILKRERKRNQMKKDAIHIVPVERDSLEEKRERQTKSRSNAHR